MNEQSDTVEAVRWARRKVRGEFAFTRWHCTTDGSMTACGLPIPLGIDGGTFWPENNSGDAVDCVRCKRYITGANMNEPNKTIAIEVPNWVAWQAIDESGTLTLFEHEPYAAERHWRAPRGRYILISHIDDKSCPRWKMTKRTVVELEKQEHNHE